MNDMPDLPAFLGQREKPDLDALAHEINVRLQKADDYRLSVALLLAKAKEGCKAAGMSFKSWAAKEIKTIGYSEVTRLANFGGTPDPAKALADYRQKTVEKVRKHRTEKVGYVTNSAPPSPPQRGKAAIVARVTNAMLALDGLPPPSEVVGYFRGTDAAVVIDEHLISVSRWLGEFGEIWSEQHAEAAE